MTIETVVQIPRGSEYLFTEIAGGQYVNELTRLKERIVDRGQPVTIVDAGANVGLFGIVARNILGSVRLYGFEPLPGLVDLCVLNWRGISSTVYPLALSDRKGKAALHLISSTGCTIEAAEAQSWAAERGVAFPKTQPVVTTTLDGFGLPRVDLFKLDIEGSEEKALRGAKATLERDRPYVICTYEHYSNDRGRIVDFMLGLGYGVTDDAERLFLTFTPE